MTGLYSAECAETAVNILERIGKVEDCMGPAVFLASEAGAFVTGQILYPDGGLTAIG